MQNKIKDEELQKIIFERPFQADDTPLTAEGEYYRILKETLAVGPETGLPENFALEVTQIALRKKRRNEIFTSVSFCFGAIGVFVIIAVVGLFFLAGDVFDLLVKEVPTYKYPVAFGISISIFIQILDGLFLRKRSTNLYKTP